MEREDKISGCIAFSGVSDSLRIKIEPLLDSCFHRFLFSFALVKEVEIAIKTQGATGGEREDFSRN